MGTGDSTLTTSSCLHISLHIQQHAARRLQVTLPHVGEPAAATCHESRVAGLLLHPPAGDRGLLPGAGAGALLRQGEGEGVWGHSGQNLHSLITLIGSRMMTFCCISNGRDIALFLMTFCKTDIV